MRKVFLLSVITLAAATALYAGGAKEQVAETPKGPVTITVKNVMAGKDWESKDTPIGQVFLEKTGVNIKMIHSVGDENQTVALLIASGDLPDVVAPHYKIAPFIDAGVALELTPLVEKYAPNLKRVFGSNWDKIRWSKEDPGRYYLTRPEEYPDPTEYRNWFFLQHAVVIDQGFPEIRTLAQFEEAIKAYVRKYPTINGQPTIGMSLLAHDWRWILSLTNPAMMAAGVQSSGEIYVDPKTKQVTYRVTREPEKAYFRWLNGMYNQGLLDREAFTQTMDQYRAKIATGRVLAMSDMEFQFNPGVQALKKEGKFDRTYGSYPVTVSKDVVTSAMSGSRAFTQPNAELVISKKSPNAIRFLQFLDFLASDEGQILNGWGIAGTQYDIVNGKRTMRQEILDAQQKDSEYGIKTGFQLFGPIFPVYKGGVKDSSGQYYQPSSTNDVVSKYSDVEKQVLKAYGKTVWADFFPKPESYPVRPWPSESQIVNKLPADSEAKVIYAKLQDTIKKGVTRAVVAKPADFDVEWQRFLDEMKAGGVEKFEDACEAIMAETMAVWQMPEKK